MKKTKRSRSLGIKILNVIVICVIAAVLFIGGTNALMILSTQSRILSVDEAVAMAESDGKFPCAIVLGAGVRNGHPSLMLADRIDSGMELVRGGATDILLFSGDNGTNEYNEVSVMRDYAMENGVSFGVTKDNIYLDHAGFSTYDSMYRLRDVFKTKRAVIVTQEYHLPRALYIADRLGIEAYGIAAAPRKSGQRSRDIREIFARTKDFLYVMTNQQPRYLGDTIELAYPAEESP